MMEETIVPHKLQMYLPGVPCHIIHRGNNRQACFFVEDDYQFYLHCLEETSQRHHVAVHAY